MLKNKELWKCKVGMPFTFIKEKTQNQPDCDKYKLSKENI